MTRAATSITRYSGCFRKQNPHRARIRCRDPSQRALPCPAWFHGLCSRSPRTGGNPAGPVGRKTIGRPAEYRGASRKRAWRRSGALNLRLQYHHGECRAASLPGQGRRQPAARRLPADQHAAGGRVPAAAQPAATSSSTKGVPRSTPTKNWTV